MPLCKASFLISSFTSGHVRIGHVPNPFPVEGRVKYVLISCAPFAYGTCGPTVRALHIPGKWRRGVHRHEATGWMMHGAIVCVCFVMVSIAVDHHEKPEADIRSKQLASTFTFLGGSLPAHTLVLPAFQNQGMRRARMGVSGTRHSLTSTVFHSPCQRNVTWRGRPT